MKKKDREEKRHRDNKTKTKYLLVGLKNQRRSK